MDPIEQLLLLAATEEIVEKKCATCDQRDTCEGYEIATETLEKAYGTKPVIAPVTVK